MAINKMREVELEKLVSEAIAQCELAGIDPLGAVELLKNARKSIGKQLSKEELAFCKSILDMKLNISEVEVEEPKTAGSSTNDAQNIGASAGSFESVEIGAGEPAQATTEEKRVKFKFDDFVKVETDGSFKIKLPKSEEEIGDLLAEVAPKFKDSAVKGVAAATSYILAQGVKSGIQGTVDSKLNDIWTKNSSTYQETGKLHPKEKAVMDGFANLANSFLSGIFGK